MQKEHSIEENRPVDRRIRSLARDFSFSCDVAARVASDIGIRRTRVASHLAHEFSLPLELAAELGESPVTVRHLRQHPLLQAFIKQSANTEINLGRRIVTIKPINIHAGVDSDGVMKSHLRFVDLDFSVFPSEEDRRQDRDFDWLDMSAKGEGHKKERKGAIGQIDFSIADIHEGPAIVVLNVQARKYFWKMRSNLRNQFRKWNDASMDFVSNIGKNIGVPDVYLSSSGLVLENAKAGWDHDVPATMLDQFYDGFARKRNYDPVSLEAVHPVTHAKIIGDFWKKPN